MVDVDDYPYRVTQVTDGRWRWMSPVDKDYSDQRLVLGTKILLLMPVGIFGFGVVLCWHYQSWEAMLYIGGFAAFLTVLILVIHVGITYLLSNPAERYQMFDTYIQRGSGQTSEFFTFKKADAVVFTRKYIELRNGITSFRTYIPEEDLEFVKRFIMQRVPEDAEMWYE